MFETCYLEFSTIYLEISTFYLEIFSYENEVGKIFFFDDVLSRDLDFCLEIVSYENEAKQTNMDATVKSSQPP